MVELSRLLLTALWHDARLESACFTWADDGALTLSCLTTLNEEERLDDLQELGLETHRVTVHFREVNDVRVALHDNYAAVPTIDRWTARAVSAGAAHEHAISTTSGCHFEFRCGRVELEARAI